MGTSLFWDGITVMRLFFLLVERYLVIFLSSRRKNLLSLSAARKKIMEGQLPHGLPNLRVRE